jgi:hypothetical protein
LPDIARIPIGIAESETQLNDISGINIALHVQIILSGG